MSQIIVSGAEVLQVHLREVKNKETKKVDKIYHSAFIFQGGDRPKFYQVNIPDDDVRELDRMIRCLDAMTRKDPVALVLDEFTWDKVTRYTYVGTLDEIHSGKKWVPGEKPVVPPQRMSAV